MIPNVVRGSRMGGLAVYLAGPGRANEHTDPHLVAGDSCLMAWYDDNTLDRASALQIARYLDQPRTAYGVEVSGGHVWHCSLSLRAEEGQLSDEQWGAISREFVDKMGFGTQDDTKAPCRFVAVRHGLSKAGNDHVHLVVNLVREDGTKASVHNDFKRAQNACRELEQAHGLQALEGASANRATRGYDPAEREATARRRARAHFEQQRRAGAETRTWGTLDAHERRSLIGAELRADQPRWELARQVRACATASADEAEFVRRMRRHGLLVRARFAEGQQGIVTGYSVAARPPAGERPIWYGGGHLARDLTLPRLRQEWPDSVQAADAAAAEWTAARRGRRPVTPGREMHEPAPELWRAMGNELNALREQLRSIPIEDRETWAWVAGQTSGAFAAWSMRLEPTPGPLAATADTLARSAQLRYERHRPQRAKLPSASGAALLLMSAARGGQGVAAQMVMLRQLANLAKAIHDMHKAAGDARQAAAIAATVRGQLATVGARLEADQRAWQAAEVARTDPQAAAAAARARTGQVQPGTASLGAPVPNPLTPRPRIDVGRPGRPGDPRQGSNERGR